MFFLFSGEVKAVCSNKTTSNNLISHSHHELKGIDGERERERERERQRQRRMKNLF